MKILGVTCLRDDGSYLVEWLAHHLAAGIDHFLVLTHDCSDGSDALLDALAALGCVTHVPFVPEGGKSVQWQALKHASAHPRLREADWALFFDCDEFLCLAPGLEDMPGLIAEAERIAQGRADAIALPWRFFGSGGQERRADLPTPERFTRAAPADLHYPLAHLLKSLIRPASFEKLGVHRPRGATEGAPVWLGPSGHRLPAGYMEAPGTICLYGLPSPGGAPLLATLNHYCLRSVDEFLVKRRRGLPNHMDREIGLDYWVTRNWNTVEDLRIAHMLPATKARMAQLLGDAEVAACHAHCLAEQARRIEETRTDLADVHLRWRLGLVGSSVPPSLAQARSFITAQRRIKADAR